MLKKILFPICCLLSISLALVVIEIYFITAENLDVFREGVREVYNIFDL